MTETLQGLHIMMVHHPEQTIRRVHDMQGVKPRWHKLMIHGEGADWVDRMPANTLWDIRNYDISEEQITDDNAERLGRAHAEIHARTLANFVARGIDPQRLAFEGRNEPLPHEFPFLARYEVARIRRAQELSVPRLVVCNFSVGQPATYGNRPDTATNWEPFGPIRDAMRPGDVLGLHQYYGVNGPWEVWPDGHMRWVCEGGRHLMCPWDVPILITEGGIDDGINGRAKVGWMGIAAPNLDAAARHYIDMVRWADQQYLADGRIVGVVLFTHDYENNEWQKFDTAENVVWEPYFAYIKAGVDASLWGDKRTARWQPVIEHWAGVRGLPAKVIATLIAVESGGNAAKLYAAGTCVGLMQLPCREAGYGAYPERQVLLHPDRNVERGTQLLVECRVAYATWDEVINAYFVGLEAAKLGVRNVTRLAQFVKAWGELWPGEPCPVTVTVTTPPPVVDPPPAPVVPTDEIVRKVAWASLYPSGGIPYNTAAAIQKYAKGMGFDQPLTKEVRFMASGRADPSGTYILQAFGGSPGAVLWCKHGDWGGIKTLRLV